MNTVTRFTAELLYDAIKNNKIIIPEFDPVIKNTLESLKTHPVKTAKSIIKKYNIDLQNLESYCGNFFSSYDSFVIIGCPHSTDIDVVCLVKHFNQSNGKPKTLLSTELNRLHYEIFEELNYDKSKDLDINLISIQNSNITSILKGGKETQNIILETYQYHKQKYPIPQLDFVKVSMLEKCRSIAKYFLDYLEFICEDYKLLRDSKKIAYANTSSMLDFSKLIIQHIDLNNIHNSKKWKNTMKSLVMKFIQLILLEHNIYSYAKLDMINKIKSIFNNLDEEGLKWYLFRGTIGIENQKVFFELNELYVKILTDCMLNIDNITLEKDIWFCTIDKQIINKFGCFFEQPNMPTEKFEQYWNKTFGPDVSINSVFEAESSTTSTQTHLLKLFDEYFHKNFIWINQRSPEWLDLLTNFYKCGTNSKEIPPGFMGKFNLIRGAIAEYIITNDIMLNEFKNFNKISLGLLVADTIKGSRGCAPDLILVNDLEIIPIEIKCLKSSIKNSDYYDSIELAQKQCDTVIEILNSFKIGYINKKIIILSWFETNKLVYRCLQINY